MLDVSLNVILDQPTGYNPTCKMSFYYLHSDYYRGIIECFKATDFTLTFSSSLSVEFVQRRNAVSHGNEWIVEYNLFQICCDIIPILAYFVLVVFNRNSFLYFVKYLSKPIVTEILTYCIARFTLLNVITDPLLRTDSRTIELQFIF